MNLGLQGKVAFVTAASKGLGKAAARSLAEEGVHLALCARSEALEATAAELRDETGVDVLAIRTDLTAPEQIEAFVRSAQSHFGRVDILILNAGGPPPGGFLDLTVEDWRAAVLASSSAEAAAESGSNSDDGSAALKILTKASFSSASILGEVVVAMRARPFL